MSLQLCTARARSLTTLRGPTAAFAAPPVRNVNDARGLSSSSSSVKESGDVGGKAGEGMDASVAKKLYDEWANGYTASVEAWGYTMPTAIATRLADKARSLLTAATSDTPVSVLDAGAGDGLSGIELRKAGFSAGVAHVAGADLSPKLLEIAASRGCYDSVHEVDLAAELPFESRAFDVVSCVGTLTYLSPSSGVLDEFVRVSRPGGFVAYNLRTDHDDAWQGAQRALVDAGKWRLLERSEPVPYLPDNPDYGDKVLTVIYTYEVMPHL
eukprot:4488783-Prymnesium_polylepis.1